MTAPGPKRGKRGGTSVAQRAPSGTARDVGAPRFPGRAACRDALVLGVHAAGEADARLTLLDAELGLLFARARNAWRSQKRFPGALSPVTRARWLLVSRDGQLWAEEAVVLDGYTGIRQDARTWALACYAIESGLAVHGPAAAAGALCAPLVEVWEHLDSGLAHRPFSRAAWELRLLDAAGVFPDLGRCLHCSGSEERRLTHAAPEAGGFLCARHARVLWAQTALESPPGDAAARVHRLTVAVSPVALESLALLAAEDLPRISPGGGPTEFWRLSREGLEVRPADWRQVRGVLDRFMAWHLGFECRSLRVMEQLSRLERPSIRS